MVKNVPLCEYVDSLRQSGYDDLTIKKTLAAGGCSEEQIRQAMSKCHHGVLLAFFISVLALIIISTASFFLFTPRTELALQISVRQVEIRQGGTLTFDLFTSSTKVNPSFSAAITGPQTLELDFAGNKGTINIPPDAAAGRYTVSVRASAEGASTGEAFSFFVVEKRKNQLSEQIQREPTLTTPAPQDRRNEPKVKSQQNRTQQQEVQEPIEQEITPEDHFENSSDFADGSCLSEGCPDCFTCNEDGTCSEITSCKAPVHCGDVVCAHYQECHGGTTCVLKEHELTYGFVYVYSDEDTYSEDWRETLEPLIPKFEAGLREITEGKLRATVDIFGEMQTNAFCWNPGEIGTEWEIIDANGTVIHSYLTPLPGSSLGSGASNIFTPENQRIASSTCENCIFDKDDVGQDVYRIECTNPISNADNLWSGALTKVNAEIEHNFGVDLEEYDGVFVVFGKLNADKSDPRYLEYKCTVADGEVNGYANLIFAENALRNTGNYFNDCRTQENFREGTELGSYQKVGWHLMIHEVLHNFGAVDLYNTGFIFVDWEVTRNEALKVDPLVDESIMGDDSRKSCMEQDLDGRYGLELNGELCSIEELERLYIDNYNRKLIGLH